jgi:DNA-binding beta-propeller fold protein YncE
MKYRFLSVRFAVSFLFAFQLTFLLYSHVGAETLPQFYTIQTGSYSLEQPAIRLYHSLAESLEPDQRDHLRIEKVGRYYTVRLGKFASWSEANKFLGSAGGSLASVLILRAYIKSERISLQYEPVSSMEEVSEPQEAGTVQKGLTFDIKEVSPEERVFAETLEQESVSVFSSDELQEHYTIQAGSYSQEQPAVRLYYSLVESLEPDQRDHLRIEKVGRYYTVRLGKFASWSEADSFLGATGGSLTGVLILQAYIKPERISLMYEPEVPEISAIEDVEVAPGDEEIAPEDVGAPTPQVDETPEKVVKATGAADFAPDEISPEFIESETVWRVEDAPEARKEELESEAIEVAQLEDEAEKIADQEPATEEPEAKEEETEEGDKARPFETLGQPTGLYPVRVVSVINKTIFGDKMAFPSDVHFDPVMKEIYLISGGGGNPSSRIMIYGPDYFPIAALGKGREVVNPSGMTVDSEGSIYISQQYSRNQDGVQVPPHIKVLNAAFFTVRDIFFDNIPGLQKEFTPANIALEPDNETLYVAGHLTKGVLVLDKDGNFRRWLIPRMVAGRVEEIGSDPNDPNGHQVTDVVVDRNGRIYLVCDPAGRIFVLDRNEEFLFAFGTKGGSTGKLSRPRGLAVDEARQAIYVVDYMRHAVNVYNYKGKYLFEVGGRGGDPGWFNFPTHVAVDHVGNLIVADYFNHRVQVLLVP